MKDRMRFTMNWNTFVFLLDRIHNIRIYKRELKKIQFTETELETKKSHSLDYYSSIIIQMYNNDINQIK